jgi:hypothetical protein
MGVEGLSRRRLVGDARSYRRETATSQQTCAFQRQLQNEALSFPAGTALRSRRVGGRALTADEVVFANLVGTHEIAERLGFKRIQRVHDWMRTEGSGFPAPVRRIGGGKGGVYIWYWPDVEAWAWHRYPERLEDWHYKNDVKTNGAAPMPLRFETSAALIEDINAGKVRTE